MRTLRQTFLTKNVIFTGLLTSFVFSSFLFLMDGATLLRMTQFLPKSEQIRSVSIIRKTKELQSDGQSKGVLLMLGGSSLREAILSERFVESELLSRGLALEAADLTSAAQPIPLSKRLATSILCKRSGVAVLAGNLFRFIGLPHPSSNPNTLWHLTGDAPNWDFSGRSRALRDLIGEGLRNMPAAMDDLFEVFNVHPNETLVGPSGKLFFASNTNHQYLHSPPVTRQLEEQLLRKMTRFIREREYKSYRNNLDIFKKTIDEILACGENSILIVVPAIHPAANANGYISQAHLSHQKQLERFEKQDGVALLRLQERNNYIGSDFADLVHLRSEDAMRVSTMEIVAAVARDTGSSELQKVRDPTF